MVHHMDPWASPLEGVGHDKVLLAVVVGGVGVALVGVGRASVGVDDVVEGVGGAVVRMVDLARAVRVVDHAECDVVGFELSLNQQLSSPPTKRGNHIE